MSNPLSAPTREALEREPCPHCGKPLKDRNALFCHIDGAHGRRKARAAVPDHPVVVRENARNARHRAEATREPSMAERVVEASLARAMGQPVDPEIEAMFDDYL